MNEEKDEQNNEQINSNSVDNTKVNKIIQNQSSDSLSVSESDLVSKRFSFNGLNNDKDLNIENQNNKEENQNNKEEKDYEILPDYKGDDFLSFKLIMIGDVSVGKSSLINRAIKKSFKSAYSPTLGFDYFSYYIKIKNKVLKLQLWDTGGQEIYQSLVTNFYRNSSLAIMVYSIDDRKSFENIDIWLKEMRTYSNPDVKIFLIGNKNDLEKKRKVDKEEGELYTKNNNIDLFMESSAKNGFNTQKLFIEASKILYKDYLMYKNKQKNKNKVESKNDEKNKLKNDDDKKKSSCC